MLIQYHDSITRKALRGRFSPRALAAVLAANLKQDDLLTGQIGHDEYHYDNNSIAKSDRYLEEQRTLTFSALQHDDPSTARTCARGSCTIRGKFLRLSRSSNVL